MPSKRTNKQLLIASSIAKQRTATSYRLSRSDGKCFLTKGAILVSAILLIVFTLTGIIVLRKVNEKMTKSRLVATPVCKNCPTMLRLILQRKRFKQNFDKNTKKFAFLKTLNRLCDKLRDEKCGFLQVLFSSQRARQNNDQQLLQQEQGRDSPIPLAYNLELNTETHVQIQARSRQKRLAQSDRRLVYLYCRTNFILQITEDGKVIGNRKKQKAGIANTKGSKQTK